MIVILSQDIKKCSARGRDCIEAKSDASFNCQASCQGIYADITHWDDRDTLTKMENVMQPIIREYKAFKQSNQKHFRFNNTAASNVFGRFY